MKRCEPGTECWQVNEARNKYVVEIYRNALREALKENWRLSRDNLELRQQAGKT